MGFFFLEREGEIWDSPAFVLLIQATPGCLPRLVSGSRRGQHQPRPRHNKRPRDCVWTTLVFDVSQRSQSEVEHPRFSLSSAVRVPAEKKTKQNKKSLVNS